MGIITAKETNRERDGHGVADKMRHFLTFNDPVTYNQARDWLARNDWLGYNPAGYGPDRLHKAPGIGSGDILVATYDEVPCSEWIWEHYASCD